MLTSRRLAIPGIVLSVALVATACGGGGDGTGTQTAGGDEPGTINASGSSTVEPITALVAEEFQGQNPDVNVTVEGPGTGDGFQKFCAGETDISDASRAIKEEEQQICQDNGVEFIELKVAIDGITALTNPANEDVGACLSFTDMYALVGPESTGFSSWSDANDLAAEVAEMQATPDTQAAPFPDVPLEISAPGEESGTYDTFVELVIEPIAEERGEEAFTRPDYNASPNDNVIIQGISGSNTSFGWVGYAFFTENEGQLKAFEVAGEDGSCVAPTDETIASGEYPLSRPLFIYVNQNKLEEKPALRDFVDLYLSDTGKQQVTAAGYVQLTDEEWANTRSTFDSAVGGSGSGSTEDPTG